MSHLRNCGSSQGSLHERNAQSTSACQRLSLSRKFPAGESLAGADDLGEAHVLGEEMRRDQHEAAHAVILHAARIDRRDRGAVAVAEQKAALKTDRVEHARQHIAGFLVHEARRARQLARARLAVAGARIDEHAGAGRRRDLVRKSPHSPTEPRPSCSITMVGAASGRGPIMRYSSRIGSRSRKPVSASVMACPPRPARA